MEKIRWLKQKGTDKVFSFSEALAARGDFVEITEKEMQAIHDRKLAEGQAHRARGADSLTGEDIAESDRKEKAKKEAERIASLPVPESNKE